MDQQGELNTCESCQRPFHPRCATELVCVPADLPNCGCCKLADPFEAVRDLNHIASYLALRIRLCPVVVVIMKVRLGPKWLTNGAEPRIRTRVNESLAQSEHFRSFAKFQSPLRLSHALCVRVRFILSVPLFSTWLSMLFFGRPQ